MPFKRCTNSLLKSDFLLVSEMDTSPSKKKLQKLRKQQQQMKIVAAAKAGWSDVVSFVVYGYVMACIVHSDVS